MYAPARTTTKVRASMISINFFFEGFRLRDFIFIFYVPFFSITFLCKEVNVKTTG